MVLLCVCWWRPECVWMDMSFWLLINDSERAWASLMHSPTLFSLLRKWPLPSPDRTEPVLNTGVMFDRQFSRLFFLQPPFLPSFSRVPGSTAPVRWRDEVGRAGTRVGRRVDKKAAVLFHLCLFFLPLIFPLLSASFFSGCPGFWFSRARAYIRPPSVWGWGFSQILWFNQHSAGW